MLLSNNAHLSHGGELRRLVYRKVFVEQTSSGLTIRQKNETNAVDLLNRVALKLPRQVSVSAKSISGDFNISGIDGAVDLNGYQWQRPGHALEWSLNRLRRQRAVVLQRIYGG